MNIRIHDVWYPNLKKKKCCSNTHTSIVPIPIFVPVHHSYLSIHSKVEIAMTMSAYT